MIDMMTVASAARHFVRSGILLWLPALMLFAGCEGGEPTVKASQPAEPETSEFRYENYVDVQGLFDELGYTSEAWMAGARSVPRVYLQRIRREWSRRTVQEIDVLTKKRLFFRILGPLVLRTNELILEDRRRLLALQSATAPALEADEWLAVLAGEYRLDPADFESDTALADALLARVDVVPVSLALSQSAEESGWGTSRFAFAGNALFGQWAWGEGIRPAQQRSGKGDYRIAAFDTPLDSVRAYAHNLNTHPAYQEFRSKRAGLRAAGKPVHGTDLVATLQRYSERGAAYVETLRSIMRVNRLHEADDAYLMDMAPVVLIPVGE